MNSANRAAAQRGDLESDIGNSVHSDANLRRVHEIESEVVITNIEATLKRLSSLSLSEIDQLVANLEALRDHLADEGERVRREVAEYALLSQSSMQSAKVIGESLAQFKAL